MIRYGIDLPPFGPLGYARLLAELACEAEMAGWDGFFIWDHVAREWQIDVVDPWVALAAAAMTTTRIRLGTLVTPMARRRPWKLARETVSLDHLSGGRLILGVGLGSGRDSEWAGLGEETDARVRGVMLDEGLDVLVGLWSGQPFSYHGQHYHVEQARFLPPPLQTPRIPIWVGGYWPNKPPFRRAACWDGVFPLDKNRGDLRPDDIREMTAYVQAHRTSETAFEVVYRGTPTPGDDLGRAAAAVAPFVEAGITWWIEPIHPGHFEGEWEGDWRLEAMRTRIRQGPPVLDRV